MQTLEYNHEDFQQSRQREADKALAVRFFYKPKQDGAASLAEGRPIFKDVLYIRIDVPGDRLGGICRPATGHDIAVRFKEGYENFMKRTSACDVVGTPLAEWPQIKQSQVEELSFFHVKTVEQLAAMSDGNGSQFMNFQALRNAAKAWLAAAKEQAGAAQLQAELAKREAEIAELREALVQLTTGAAVPKPAAVKKKPGRPPRFRPAVAPTTQ